MAQWETFLKRRRKKRPSGSAIPPASLTPPSSTSASSEAEHLALPPQSLPPPSEGCDRSEEVEGVHRVGSRKVPLPLPFSRRKERGEAPRGPWLLRV